MNAEARILEPGQIEPPAGQIPFLHLAGKDVFRRRELRFLQLAQDHPFADYLDFMANLSQAQHEALDSFPAVALPDDGQLARRREHAMPPLGAQDWRRDPAWRDGLKKILWHMAKFRLNPLSAEAVVHLLLSAEDELEAIADKLLAGDLAAVRAQDMPFVAAALQVYWVRMADTLGEGAFGRLEQGGLCPVCGSQPVSGTVHIGGAEQGLRYLTCSLCASHWHMVRIKCSHCESTGGISYHALEGSKGEVKAESCDDCNSYLKILYMDKDCEVEAVADDIATLPIDMLMDRAGKLRNGANLLFHPGSV